MMSDEITRGGLWLLQAVNSCIVRSRRKATEL